MIVLGYKSFYDIAEEDKNMVSTDTHYDNDVSTLKKYLENRDYSYEKLLRDFVEEMGIKNCENLQGEDFCHGNTYLDYRIRLSFLLHGNF